MDIFLEKHKEAILGVVEGFDRIIFKGNLTSMFPDGAFGRYLSRRGILLKEGGKFFERETEAIIRHAKTSAEQAGRPYAYLESAPTHASGQSKEAKARAIAERDGITEGLVGIFSVQDAEVGHGANSRSINALANAPLQGEATEILDRLCRSQSKAGQHVAAVNPMTQENCALFEALLSGEFALNGFRNNRDLQGKSTLPDPRMNRRRPVEPIASAV